jgi:hypothetical protein
MDDVTEAALIKTFDKLASEHVILYGPYESIEVEDEGYPVSWSSILREAEPVLMPCQDGVSHLPSTSYKTSHSGCYQPCLQSIAKIGSRKRHVLPGRANHDQADQRNARPSTEPILCG